jgi:hypothetical protein
MKVPKRPLMSRKSRLAYIDPAQCQKLTILLTSTIWLTACATVPPVTCPPPPGEFMAPPAPLPRLEGGSARQVFQALVRDQEAHAVNSARLTGLQDWGRTWCGWGHK